MPLENGKWIPYIPTTLSEGLGPNRYHTGLFPLYYFVHGSNGGAPQAATTEYEYTDQYDQVSATSCILSQNGQACDRKPDFSRNPLESRSRDPRTSMSIEETFSCSDILIRQYVTGFSALLLDEFEPYTESQLGSNYGCADTILNPVQDGDFSVNSDV